MKKNACFLAFWCALLISANATSAEVLATESVVSEISRRSGLPQAELDKLLSDCGANQQSMYFCAWRDQIAAERSFRRILTSKADAFPKCRRTLESEAVKWMKSRNEACNRAAAREWGEGSMRATAKALCIAAATTEMTARLEKNTDCRFPR